MTALSPSDLLAVVDNAGADNETALAMLTGAYLESGADPNATGGGAYGVWQLQGNPRGTDTAYAAGVMEPRYAAAAAQVPASLWANNPENAAEETAYLAERPAQDYFTSQGSGRVAAAYQWALAAIGGTAPAASAPAGSTANAGSGDSGTIEIPVGPWTVNTGIPDAAGMAHYGLIALGAVAGLALLILGVTKAVDAHPVRAVADTAKTAAGAAALA